MGQKRTYAVQNGMSALPPIATAKADLRKTPCVRLNESSNSKLIRDFKLHFPNDISPIVHIVSQPNLRLLEVSVYDKGEYHALIFSCRRDGSGWLDARANRRFLFEPTHWRPWKNEQP